MLIVQGDWEEKEMETTKIVSIFLIVLVGGDAFVLSQKVCYDVCHDVLFVEVGHTFLSVFLAMVLNNDDIAKHYYICMDSNSNHDNSSDLRHHYHNMEYHNASRFHSHCHIRLSQHTLSYRKKNKYIPSKLIH